MGMDVNTIRAFPWFQAIPVLSRILGELFRRETLCDEGRLATHCRLHVAALVPQLVPAALSLRLRKVPHSGGIIHGHPNSHVHARRLRNARRRFSRGRSRRTEQKGAEGTAIEVFV